MDALALLCNLYGDGPATLKRLKSAGLSSVESLDDIEAPRLAETLETTEAAARRFLREARLLGERMLESGFEEEASPPIAHHGSGPVPIIELEPAGPPVEAQAGAGSGASAEVREVPRERAPETETGRAAVGEETTLELRLLDGLSGAWCERFAELGLRSVEDLARMDTLRVSEQLGEGLTRLDRFRFLARRHLAAAPDKGPPSDVTPGAASPAILVPRPPRSVPVTPAPSPPPAPSGALATEPWPSAPAAAVKFSLAGTPFSCAPGPLAGDLDSDAKHGDTDAGSAGPFG